MVGDADMKRTADKILDGLPEKTDEAAHVALAVAAAKCIDAGLTDDEAGKGLLASLRSWRERLKRARVN